MKTFDEYIKEGITREALQEARDRYLEYETTAPYQFNIWLDLEDGWGGEFMPYQGETKKGLRWLGGDEVVDLFFSLDTDIVNESITNFKEDWVE